MLRPSTVLPRLPLLGLLATLAACAGEDGDAAPEPESPITREAPSPSDAPAPTEAPGSRELDLSNLGFDEGDAGSAVVQVIEFSDFGCVFCARFHTNDYHELREEFVETGEVAWRYIPITIGGFPNGEGAALAGICAGEQDRFASMRDLLYEERERWLAAEDGLRELWEEYGAAVGLDLDRFRSCLDGESARDRITRGNQAAVSAGVRGTPTFVIHGYPVQGAPALENFQEALRGLIAELRAAEAAGDR